MEAERRLFDMLAGWSNFADADEWSSDDEVEAITELYQQAGRMEEPITDEKIKAFVIDKVIPFLLTGK